MVAGGLDSASRTLVASREQYLKVPIHTLWINQVRIKIIERCIDVLYSRSPNLLAYKDLAISCNLRSVSPLNFVIRSIHAKKSA